MDQKPQGGSRRRGSRSLALQCGLLSAPVGEGADGVAAAETTEVGIQWVFMGLWAVWLEQKGVLGEEGEHSSVYLFVSQT